MTEPGRLIDVIRTHTDSVESPEIDALRDALHAKYGDAILAVLFYGSCLRSGAHREGLVDLYVIVNSYREAYGHRLPALANKILPPNVYYLEVPLQKGMVRCKYAVVSMRDFQKTNSMKCFHSYFWARFAQPTGIAWVREPAREQQILEAFANAVVTFLNRVLPYIDGTFTVAEIWQQGLLLTYGAELRAEQAGGIVALYDANPDYYRKAFVESLPLVRFEVNSEEDATSLRYRANTTAVQRALNRAGWRARKVQGKLLSVLRLSKALFTFQAGVEYILWKIERHSGVKAEIPPRLENHPLLASIVLFWRIRRRGGFR